MLEDRKASGDEEGSPKTEEKTREQRRRERCAI